MQQVELSKSWRAFASSASRIQDETMKTLFMSLLIAVATAGTADEDIAMVCDACRPATRWAYDIRSLDERAALESISYTCFSHIKRICFALALQSGEEMEDLGDDAVWPPPGHDELLLQFRFCAGHTAQHKEELSMAAIMRLGQFLISDCSHSQDEL
jgi:hypothetical protein